MSLSSEQPRETYLDWSKWLWKYLKWNSWASMLVEGAWSILLWICQGYHRVLCCSKKNMMSLEKLWRLKWGRSSKMWCLLTKCIYSALWPPESISTTWQIFMFEIVEGESPKHINSLMCWVPLEGSETDCFIRWRLSCLVLGSILPQRGRVRWSGMRAQGTSWEHVHGADDVFAENDPEIRILLLT